MYISKLKVSEFRNYINKEMELSKDINIFYGKNANGKTNLLEAIYICGLGKSFRTRKDSEMIKFESEIGKVEISYIKRNTENIISFLITNQNKKQIKINGIKITKTSEIFGNIYLVLFSPEDLLFIKGDPSVRRKYIDILISQLSQGYVFLLQEYYKTLEQKNNLLKERRRVNELEIDVWDEKLIELNLKINEIRRKKIEEIIPYLKKYCREISGGEEEPEIIYKTQIKNKEKLFEEMKNKRKTDIERGFSSIGIHRDDYLIKANNIELGVYGSQGQIRTIMLAMKLAQKELIKEKTGETPILLLDDVMSELDEDRRKYITNEIKECQVIITCTDVNEINIDNAKLFLINENK